MHKREQAIKYIKNPGSMCVACCVVAIEEGSPVDLSALHLKLLNLEQNEYRGACNPGLTSIRSYFRGRGGQADFLPGALPADICRLRTEGKHVVVETKGCPGHAIVVKQVMADEVVVMDPDWNQPERRVPIAEFLQLRNNRAGCVMNCCWIQLPCSSGSSIKH